MEGVERGTHTIGAIVRGDLWGRFFDFRPRWGVTRVLPPPSLSVCVCASSTLVAESGGDTAKLSEGSGFKGRSPIYSRGKKEDGIERKEDREGRGRRCGLISFEAFLFRFFV